MFILLSGQFGCRRIVRMLFLSSVVTQPLFVCLFLLIFVTAYSLLALGSFHYFIGYVTAVVFGYITTAFSGCAAIYFSIYSSKEAIYFGRVIVCIYYTFRRSDDDTCLQGPENQLP